MAERPIVLPPNAAMGRHIVKHFIILFLVIVCGGATFVSFSAAAHAAVGANWANQLCGAASPLCNSPLTLGLATGTAAVGTALGAVARVLSTTTLRRGFPLRLGRHPASRIVLTVTSGIGGGAYCAFIRPALAGIPIPPTPRSAGPEALG